MARPLSVELTRHAPPTISEEDTSLEVQQIPRMAAPDKGAVARRRGAERARLGTCAVVILAILGLGALFISSVGGSNSVKLHSFYLSTSEVLYSSTSTFGVRRQEYGKSGQMRYCIRVDRYAADSDGFVYTLICGSGKAADNVSNVGLLYAEGTRASVRANNVALKTCYNASGAQEEWMLTSGGYTSVYITDGYTLAGEPTPKAWSGEYKGFDSMDGLLEEMEDDVCYCPTICPIAAMQA